eukprot:COSAG01_NODE_53287_length_340_cov_0.858921_1_plen_84_part_10
MIPARFPNKGYAYIRRIFDKGAVARGGHQYNFSNPVGANFSLVENPTGDWEREYAAGFTSGVATGYMANDFFRESHRIARVRLW